MGQGIRGLEASWAQPRHHVVEVQKWEEEKIAQALMTRKGKRRISHAVDSQTEQIIGERFKIISQNVKEKKKDHDEK